MVVFSESKAQDKKSRDSTLVTVLPDSIYDASVYALKGNSLLTRPFKKSRSGLVQLSITVPEPKIEYDPKSNTYTVTQSIDGVPFGEPIIMTFDEFFNSSKNHISSESFKRLAQQANNKRAQEEGLLDFKFSVPGGNSSVFSTIFGKPEVNLRVTGTANMNIGASIQRDENPAIPEDQRQRIDPTFEQNLKLNIQGGIGDKLTINTDWDTERPFDYQNRLRIVYQGYDDEIIKSIELGNVGMQTGNSLISGGQALFGIKSVAQLGDLTLTSVLSQKEGQGNSKSIDGGSTEEQFSLNPTDYEDGRHFYLDFYSYDYYDEALEDPYNRLALYNINQIKVYKIYLGTQRLENLIQGVAFVDLGSHKDLLSDRFQRPNPDLDGLDDTIIQQIRESSLDTLNVAQMAEDLGVEEESIAKGFWIPLVQNQDYIVDEIMGTISLLNQTLQSNEVLAVAYQDQTPNGLVNVGDVITLGEQVQILKLIRQQNLNPGSETWDLTMRNVYPLGVSNINSEGFDFGMYFTGGTTQQQNLPGIAENLLQQLGLDRFDQNQTRSPDNIIDFSTGVLNSVTGKIYFPYREPFGERIVQIINQSSIPDKEAAIEEFAFPELYDEGLGIARQIPKRNLYEMSGTVKGGTSGSYFLGIALVEGSVRVFANGVELNEGTDYDVDYTIGNVYITNQRYLSSGQQITIDYESNNIVQIQQTTFTGVRGEYQLTDNITLGATVFNLQDRPLTDKIRVGDEPINNSVYGFDTKGQFDAPWLTKAIDWLPLIETKANSSINFAGEFAQLRPGVAQTNAVQAAIDDGRLYRDEENGVSFIDEFEGSKVSFTFNTPIRWNLAAAPASLPGYDVDLSNPISSQLTKIDRTDRRAKFAWYNVPINVSSVISTSRNRETRLIQVEDIFDRQTLQQDNFLNTLDVFFNPRERGIYNYNKDLKDLLENHPEDTWGGMTATLPQGLENLTLNNIEFIEFWVQAIVPDSILGVNSLPSNQILDDYDGKVYIDLGRISEDIIPNILSNNEDGLAQGGVDNLEFDNSDPNLIRSLVLDRPVDFDGQFSNTSIEQEDVGLDGIPNEPGLGGYNEVEIFSDFLESIRQDYGENSEMYQKALADPSNDDYFYWAESSLSSSTLQERFLRMFGYSEQNSRTTGEKRAITNRPDAEGLLIPTAPNLRDAYFQYEIELNPADPSGFQQTNPYLVDVTNDRNDPGQWYQIRIPLDEFKRKVGNIEDFQAVTHMRLWMSGYKRPFTLRFATYELVGSQWFKAENVGNLGNTSTDFFISTINIEENRSRRPIPYVSPTGAVRAINRTQQGNLLANEQALSMEVRDLRSGDIRMIRRNFTGGMNMINYSNLRMFVHAEGYDKRGEAEIILRMGRDLERDYYEYRQPLTPTDTTFFTAIPSDPDQALQAEIEEQVWLPDENAVNIVLSSLNALKQLRNLRSVDPSLTFYDSTLVENAPVGTRIGIKGNPSLQQIQEIGIGIMNPSKLNPDGTVNEAQKVGLNSLDAIVWVNELRVSGFDNLQGWAANTSASVQLADLGRVSGKLSTSTAGFGSLNSRLGTRRRDDRIAYDVSTTLNAHKFIPEKYGWNIPLGFSFNQSLSTPQFLPREGDIRLTDFQDAVRAQTISDEEKDVQLKAKLREIQTFTERLSFSLNNLSKRNSTSPWLKYTLDNLNLNYSYSQDNNRNIERVYDRGWNFNAGASYSLTLRKVDLLRPFWFAENLPWLGKPLYGIQLGYLPTSINLSGTLTRNYKEWLNRSFDETELFKQQTHQYGFNNSFGFNYNFMPSIPISFRSQSKYVLNDAGETRLTDDPNEPFEVVPTFKSLEQIFTVDSVKARLETYSESYGASWRPQTSRNKALNWLAYTVSYQGSFNWRNSPQGSNLGANIGNSYRINQTLSLKLQNLLQKIPFYDDWKKADAKETRDRVRQAAQEKRRKEREARLAKLNKNRKKKTPTKSTNKKANTKAKSTKKGDENNDLVYYSRKFGLALFSIQNFDINYSDGANSRQNGYSGGSSFFDAFNSSGSSSFSPPLNYRLGFKRRLEDIIVNPNTDRILNINVNETFTNNLTITSRLQPLKTLSIDLNMNVGWNRTVNNIFNLEPESNTDFDITLNESGDYTSSAWTFGGDFEQFFRYQLQRGLDDWANPNDGLIDDAIGNQDGLTILDRDAILQDFIKTFISNPGPGFGKKGYVPFPLPNWKINWTGVEKIIPYAEEFVSRISINHSYQGAYRLGWIYNPQFGEVQTGRPINGVNLTVNSEIQRYEPNSISLDRRFVPFIGMNITWNGNVSTRLQYDYSKMLTLSAQSPLMNERESAGFTFSGSWSKRGFRLPFFRKLRNTLDLTVTGSYYEETSTRRQLTAILASALNNGYITDNANDYEYVDNSDLSIAGDTRVRLSGLVGYQFSSMVKANFEYTYDHVIPKSTQTFERTTQNIRFNVIVSIRSN